MRFNIAPIKKSIVDIPFDMDINNEMDWAFLLEKGDIVYLSHLPK